MASAGDRPTAPFLSRCMHRPAWSRAPSRRPPERGLCVLDSRSRRKPGNRPPCRQTPNSYRLRQTLKPSANWGTHIRLNVMGAVRPGRDACSLWWSMAWTLMCSSSIWIRWLWPLPKCSGQTTALGDGHAPGIRTIKPQWRQFGTGCICRLLRTVAQTGFSMLTRCRHDFAWWRLSGIRNLRAANSLRRNLVAFPGYFSDGNQNFTALICTCSGCRLFACA